jgi:hypothetical protein
VIAMSVRRRPKAFDSAPRRQASRGSVDAALAQQRDSCLDLCRNAANPTSLSGSTVPLKALEKPQQGSTYERNSNDRHRD